MTARSADGPGAPVAIDADAHDRFVALSGDRSPLHVDAAHARRTAFGAPVVHGVHLVLRVLEGALHGGGERVALEHLDAEFRAHVGVGMPVGIDVDDGDGLATVLRGGRVAARVRWRFAPTAGDVTRGAVADGPAATGTVDPTPDDVTVLAGAHHREPLRLDAALLAGLLPAVAARLAPADVAALLATTRLVGMRWPGERALLRRVRVARHDDGPVGPGGGDLTAEVVAAHRATGLVRCEVRAGGTIVTAEAQARPPVVRQPALADLRALVPAGRFAGVRAWVVGGGRGIGETAAKLLAAGGAEVLVSGRDAADATRVAHEVRGRAETLDVTAEPDAGLADRIAGTAPTHLVYFAAPSLLPLGPDDAEGRRTLTAVLRDGLRMCVGLAGGPSALRGVLVPSSVLVDEPAPGFEAYAAVKTAVEEDLAAMAAEHPGLRVSAPRLPQLLSDQTAGVSGPDPGRTVAVLLPELERWILEGGA